jgi:hypothetical protein
VTHTCPVCGFNDLNEPPYSRDGHGLFEICPSCGFQFGVTDDDLGMSFREWRESWVAKGMPWSSKGRTAAMESPGTTSKADTQQRPLAASVALPNMACSLK